jgi:putative nucleotidyltransferase with HDIG domain
LNAGIMVKIRTKRPFVVSDPLKVWEEPADKSAQTLMQSQPVVEIKAAAHARRVVELSQRLAARLHSLPVNVFELCDAFDEAVEFSALEGLSVAEAITAFYEDAADSGWTHPVAALAQLTGRGSPAVDLKAMSLPVMPRQISRLLRTSNEETSPAELESITGSDPVLAGKLLGAANSARFGSQFEIVRLREAIMRLGIPEVRKILLASCFSGLFASKPLHDLWKHSQAVAETACGLARLAEVDAETAYLAGLLHDVGRLGFARLPPHLRIRELDWLAAGFPVVYAETLAYGMDHARLGAEHLRAWELPEAIVEAVEFHHRPERCEAPLGAILTVAEGFAADAARAGSEDLWVAMRRAAACLTIGITVEQLEEFRLMQTSLQACA